MIEPIPKRRLHAGALLLTTSVAACLLVGAFVLAVALAGAQEPQAAKSVAERAEGKPARISLAGKPHRLGARVGLSGRIPVAVPSAVKLRFRAAGGRAWHDLQRLATNRKGVFTTRLKARRTGAIQAVPRFGDPSPPRPIRVRAKARFKVSDKHLDLGEKVRLFGLAEPGGRRPFKVVVRGPEGKTVKHSTDGKGRFRQGWRPRSPGTYTLRAFAGKNAAAAGAAGPSRRITVYRPAHASWFGPGLYGNSTACGQTLTSGLLGVAHKTLPCGTKLTLRHGSRRVRTEVIDRGPFIPGREFDLTLATRDRLGFGDLGTVYVNR